MVVGVINQLTATHACSGYVGVLLNATVARMQIEESFVITIWLWVAFTEHQSP